MNPSASFPNRMDQAQTQPQPYLNAQQARDPARRPSPVSRPFQPSHSYSQSTSVLSNNSGRQMQQQQQQQQPPGSMRSASMRPLSAFQPLDNPDYYAGTGSQRPSSPTGSVARSVRSSQAPLTFKSQDLRSALSLQEAQQKKLYMEGYLLKREDLGTDGKPIHTGDAKRQWSECFVQLSGTVLSSWNVDQMEEAARQGIEVPPTYINITDSFVDFIGLLIEDPKLVPGSRGRYHHAFAINSGGNNRNIFCFRDPPPFPPDLIEQWLAPEHRQRPEHKAVIGWLNLGHRHLQAWINAIRLASWEKVRLEEIYTGALIRARLGGVGAPGAASADATKDASSNSASEMVVKSPLVKGKLEGWVKARFMGTTEWKKVWLVLTDHKAEDSDTGTKKKFWKLGGAGDRSSVLSMTGGKGATSPGPPGAADLPPPPGGNGAPGVANFFETKKSKKPFASLIYGAHAFAVYPSRPELVDGSSLFKVEGVFPSSTVLSATHRVRTTGWVMLMPELEGAGSKGANAEMMKWILAFMDSFKLYGRPENIIWDARNPASPFFAYPIGPFKERLFLDRELAEFLEIAREDHLTTRSSLHGIMSARMRGERTKILQPLPPPSLAESAQRNAAGVVPQAMEANDVPRSSQTLPPLDFISGQGKSSLNSEARSENAHLKSQDAFSQSGMNRGMMNSGNEDRANNDSLRGLSPSFENRRPDSRPGFAPSHGSHSVNNDSRASETHTDTKTNNASRALPAPPQMQAAQKSQETLASSAPHQQNLQPSRAPPVEHMNPPQSADATRSSPAAANEPLPSYPDSSMDTKPLAAGANTNSASNAPHTFGPSGQSAGAAPANNQGTRRESIPPSSYDESTLFYMASLSDQLPVASSHPPTARAPVQAQAAALSSQASQSQGLGPNSSTTSAVPSESTHATKVSNDPVRSMDKPDQQTTARSGEDSINDDALAAYSYLDQPHSPVVNTQKRSFDSSDPSAVPAANTRHVISNAPQAASASSATSTLRPVAPQYPSTFGQNKRSTERKTAAQLQAQAHQEALSRPGRAGGIKTKDARGWKADDSESDDDEESEEDEEGDEYADQQARGVGSGQQTVGSARGADSPAAGMSDSIGSLGRSHESGVAAQGPRSLPLANSVYAQSMSGGGPDNGYQRSLSPGRAGQPHPSMQAPNRQSMFNSHLTAAHGNTSGSNTPPQSSGSRDRQTFLQLNPEEQPGAMTTVFTPHGLVQAGAQDKVDRSAKTQEATARALGSNLVNVPNKPPPPQAGLLGAITAHERDRKGAGGLGATLTERERERVAAERRQREEDAFSVQQQQQMQQQQQQQMQQMAYFNPMMYQQMMMGGMGGMGGMMPGMMGMGMPHMGGFGGSQMGGSQMGGFDPMMAQQQAMQAAQMAYMNALSQAHQEGSVMGHGSISGHQSSGGLPHSTSMMGMPMGGMPFMSDPRMSMMGTPYPGFMGAAGMGSPGSENPNPSSRPTSARPGQNGQVPERD